MQAHEGDGEAHGVGVAAQFGDLPGQGAQLLGAFEDEGVDALVALLEAVGALSLSPRPRAKARDLVPRGAQGHSQFGEPGRERLDLGGATVEEANEAGELVEQGEVASGGLLDGVHLRENAGHGPLGPVGARDAHPGGHEGGDLGGHGLPGEVHGGLIPQRLELAGQGGLPRGGGLPAGGASRGRGGLDFPNPREGPFEGIALLGQLREGADGQVAAARGDDGGEDPVVPAVGGAVGDVGAGGVAGLDVLPHPAEEPGGHDGVAHDVVGPPHERPARVAGQAHEDRVGPADAARGVRGGEEDLVGLESALLSGRRAGSDRLALTRRLGRLSVLGHGGAPSGQMLIPAVPRWVP